MDQRDDEQCSTCGHGYDARCTDCGRLFGCGYDIETCERCGDWMLRFAHGDDAYHEAEAKFGRWTMSQGDALVEAPTRKTPADEARRLAAMRRVEGRH